MKITILSDTHLGHGSGTERSEDPFDALEETLGKSTDSDIIIFPGDVFDSRNPSTETITRAMKLLLKPMMSDNATEIAKGIDKDISQLSPIHSLGIPVVAISGTHERKARDQQNIVQSLEDAGFLIYLHCNGIVFQKGNEKVCIQGMSGVPEDFSQAVLKEWGPKPSDGCTNILMLHQNLVDFMYPQTGLSLSDLPKGFDLYACGHIHNSQIKKLDKGQLLICGSPITTQLKEEETGQKGFWEFDTKALSLDFKPLDNARKAYILSFDSGKDSDFLIKEIEELLKNNHSKKPLIKINITGKEPGVYTKDITSRFEDDAIILFKRVSEKEKTQPMTLEEHKLSVQELSKKLLEKNLKESGLDPRLYEDIFELLLDKKFDKALNILNKKAVE